MARIDIREARSAAELEQAQAIRCAVFVAGVAEALEVDGLDGAPANSVRTHVRTSA